MGEIILSGPVGRLEGRYTDGDLDKAMAVLFLHPNPRQGGTMNNKVIYTLFQSFANKGFSCLRINFRGVGRSEGHISKNEGQLEDATSALDWLQQNQPHIKSFWVVGFSFGAWIAMQLLMRRPEINHFVAIAPPIGQLDFGFLIPCPAPGLILQGDRDSMTSENLVKEFIDKLNAQKKVNVKYTVIPGANHSFSTHLNIVEKTVSDYVDYKILTP